MSGIELVALDVDGVIRDSSRLVYEGYRVALEKVGLDEEFTRCFGVRELWHFKGLGVFNNRRESFRAISMMLSTGSAKDIKGILYRDNAEEYIIRLIKNGPKLDSARYLDEMVDAYVGFFNSEEEIKLTRIYTEAKKFTQNIHNLGIGLAIVTNSGIASVNRDLPKDMLKLFRMVITPKDLELAKPSGEGLRLLSNKLGIDAKKMVYIGDTVVDIRAAKDAGCISVSVLSGMGLRIHLERENPDQIFENLEQAEEWIIRNR